MFSYQQNCKTINLVAEHISFTAAAIVVILQSQLIDSEIRRLKAPSLTIQMRKYKKQSMAPVSPAAHLGGEGEFLELNSIWKRRHSDETKLNYEIDIT